jgi:hypothetical protein
MLTKPTLLVLTIAGALGSAAVLGSCIEMCSCTTGGPGKDYEGVVLIVQADGGSLGTVGATFKGSGIDESMQCQRATIPSSVACAWSGGGPEDAGPYQGSLQVEAQGYSTVTISAEITVTHVPGGSCCDPVPFSYARLAPDWIVLEPASPDGGA